ncbi:hypothetical protein [Dermatobacter hominis]|uniref:hypothetical protein n=1 Tax=Dermatobacter hominis TaxID=2884263 RepID=UPI001D12AD8F|nr:hypothetical protein [Dermatobacter hominis]UDY36897.1 hypothetical protein LH044_05030 [Dermatobacter hominis]
MISRRALTPILLVAATAATVVLLAASCGGGDAPAAPPTTPAAPGAGHDGGDGMHPGMAPEVTTAAELASLGQGPGVGETFSGHLGLDVCGRFLAPPAASTPDDGSAASGITTDGAGGFTVAPPTGAVAGHRATIGRLASQAGIELGDGSVSFPAATSPGRIDVGGTGVAVAGRTFGPDATCGGTPAEVQLWVYTADAVATGEHVRTVVDDPAEVPIVEDGMAFVIAVAPESSLPTLPPSAILG